MCNKKLLRNLIFTSGFAATESHMSELVGNVLMLQMGKPSAVTNAILAALIKKSLNYGNIEEVYGCFGGLNSILNEQFIDLAAQPQKTISNLICTPGAALKSIDSDHVDAGKIVQICKKHDIVYMFVVGDDTSVEACKLIDLAAKKNGYNMRVILIPTVANNGLQLTDHCLGYGSMAKHMSLLVRNITSSIQSRQGNGAITIIHIDGCSDEWILSSAALARGRKDSNDIPHIVILSRFDEGTFVKNAHQALRNFGNCVVVVGSRLIDISGEPITVKESIVEHVKMIASANFDVQIDTVTLHDWELTSCMTLSSTDVAECELCAQKALELAIGMGVSSKMITLLRADASRYTSEITCVDLDNVSSKKKTLPEDWYVYEEMMLDVPFFKYASPLIIGEVSNTYENGLPVLAKLR